ncbi:hypothetical protein [Rothia sp. ZJ1223]|uniref:hypothetical protein n=1 Tax=Rothia sp. ZJ1223 TaxID=2811098 RepID=UPI001958E944|nr:hypothetical protein [Rothia sp. ZJ1223]MBM7052139.1 hypothetical protein [Rothia sp. ZJ1223]
MVPVLTARVPAVQSLVRADELSHFTDRLEGNPRSPLFIAALTGFGKTTLLQQFESMARTHQWRVISESAGRDSHKRLRGTYLPALWESLETSPADADLETFTALPLPQQLESITRVLASQNSGLLITVDDLRKSSARELTELLDTAEHLAAQEQPLLLVMAGRPAEVCQIMSAHAFAGSGHRIDLSPYNRNQVQDELAALFAQSNRTVHQDILERASGATKGHPFMVYTLGQNLLQSCAELTEGELENGIASAQQSLEAAIFEPMLEDFSAGDRAFLHAMATDDAPSKMSDIASRLGKTPQYAGVYRNRLVEAHIIRPASYGKVTFAVPHLREYLRNRSEPRNQDFEF